MTDPTTPTDSAPGLCACGCGLPVAKGRRFVAFHHNRLPRTSTTEAFRVAYDQKMAESTEPVGLCGCGCRQSAPVARKSNLRKGWIKGLPKRWIAGHQGWAQPRRRPVDVVPGTCGCGCRGMLTERSKQDKFRKYLPAHSPKYARAIDASDLSQASRDAFWANVGIVDHCLVWHGIKNKKGYGVWTDPATNRHYLAHRVAAALMFGSIAAGVQRNHFCDVGGHGPSCVSPWHTWSGSQSQNLYHAAGAGLMPRKLSASNVLELRSLYQSGVTQRVLAERFGIRQSHVSMIVTGKAWLHLVDPNAPPRLPRPRKIKAA